MSDGDEAAPSDRMRGRIHGSRLRVWLLLAASRRLVVAALLGGLFIAFVALGALDPVGLGTAMARGDPIETLFQALLTAIITGVTLVITINQLVISQELGAVGEPMADVIEALELFGPAREHVKTLYFQWELIDLSRAVIYAAVPALVVASGMVLYVDASTVPGATLGIDNLVWVASGAAAVALLPFAVLLVYILRIATVTKRTLAIGPFVLRETDRSPDVDWD